MKVSKNWLKELVDLKISIEELIKLLPLRTIAVKEATDKYFELDMKGYNRADLLSVRGVAYEVAAITNAKVKFTEDTQFVWDKTILPKAQVRVEDQKLAPLYCIAKIENLKVAESNDKWKQKLNESGIRSVNNLADVTNLVMIEYGQPLHAFDAAEVKDETIIVRTAKTGEELTTLDGKHRKLNTTDLLITDPQKVLGLAGVMGGKNSEVSDSTSTILLEAAIFDPKTLRQTATRLSLVSEASKRFYHGLTKKRLFQALDAAIRMYQSLGGKLTALTIIDNWEDKSATINLTQTKVNSLIGVEIPKDRVEKYLRDLAFNLEGLRTNSWQVTPPYYRLDIEIEEDVIEEVARMYGYEKIPAKPLSSTNTGKKANQALFELIETLKQALLQAGLTEVQTYSFYSTKVLEALGFNGADLTRLVKLANPMSKETEYLRENNWPNLVEVVAKNTRQGMTDIAVFEIGKIYYHDEKGKVAEKYCLSIALMNGSENPLAELLAVFEKVNKQLGLNIERVKSSAKLELFHPNRFIQLTFGNKSVGGLAEVHKRVTDKMGILERVAILEIGLSKLF